MWFSRLLSSSPGAPEMHNACLLLATIGLIAFTGATIGKFDPLLYAEAFSLLLGGTGVAALLTSGGRKIEGDAPTPNENSLPPPKGS